MLLDFETTWAKFALFIWPEIARKYGPYSKSPEVYGLAWKAYIERLKANGVIPPDIDWKLPQRITKEKEDPKNG